MEEPRMIQQHHVGFASAGIFLLVAIVFGTAWVSSLKSRLRMEGDIRVHEQREKDNNEKIKANDTTTKAAQGTIDTAVSSNKQIDTEHSQKQKEIENQWNSKPDKDQVLAMIHAAMPGLNVTQGKDAQGNATLEIAGTRNNLDAINKTDADFKSCRFNLDECQRKQANFESIVAALNTQLGAANSTIGLQKESIGVLDHDLKRATSFGKGGNVWARTGRVYIPLGCAAGGAWLSSPRGPKAAAIGALVAGTACSFTIHF